MAGVAQKYQNRGEVKNIYIQGGGNNGITSFLEAVWEFEVVLLPRVTLLHSAWTHEATFSIFFEF